MSRRSPAGVARVAAAGLILACAVISGCAAPSPGIRPPPEAAVPPDYADQLVSLVESYQPADPFLPNRWSQAVRTAFIYSGAQRLFAAGSPAVRAYTAASDSHRPDDFVAAALGELDNAPPDLAPEARRFLDALESEQLLLHLHEIAEPCRLLAPPPFRGFNSPLASQETYEQGPLRNLADACRLRMRTAAEQDRPAVFLGAFASGMQIGRTLCGRPMLLSLMNAQVTQNRVMLEALRDVREYRLNAATCRALLDETERSGLPPPAIFLRMERIIGLDAIDRYFDRKVAEQAAPADGAASITDLSHAESVAVFEAAIERCGAILERETGTSPRPDPLSVRPHPTAAGPFAPMLTPPPLQIPEGRTDPDGLLATLIPPMGPMVMGVQEHACTRAGLVTGLLLELHRAAHGEYPRTLTELAIPDVNVAPPRDPYAPDRPLGYRPPVPADGPVAGGYTLYSVGADGADNNGTPPRRGRREALYPPPRSAGTDFIVIDASSR